MLIRLFGVLLLLSALALPLVRAPDWPVQTLVARWAPPPSAFVELKGQLVHYRDEGPKTDPAPIVLLHGTSASLHTWEGWAKALRGQRRVISLDLPGFGLTGPFTGDYAAQASAPQVGGTHASGPPMSGPQAAGPLYTGERYAGFVLDLLDHLGVARFVVAGNSLGGEVAWRIAAAAPQRVTQLVLVDAAGYRFDPGGDIPLGWRIARLPLVGRIAEHVLPRPLVVQGLVAAYADPRKISDALVDRYFELTLREGNRAALGQRLREYSSSEGVDHVTGITAPTLVLWGGQDRLIEPEYARRFVADIPDSRLVIFDDLGHLPQEEDPARTVAAVQDFLGPGPR